MCGRVLSKTYFSDAKASSTVRTSQYGENFTFIDFCMVPSEIVLHLVMKDN